MRSCDLLLLLMAFRRGWVPTCEEGGNGNASVTAGEVDEARRRGIPVRALLACESWPGSLWEDDQDARIWVRQFRQGLNQVAKFFEVGEFDDRRGRAATRAGFPCVGSRRPARPSGLAV